MQFLPGKSIFQIQHKIHFNIGNRYAKNVWNKRKSSWRYRSAFSCIITNAPYIQHEQFQLDDSFKTNTLSKIVQTRSHHSVLGNRFHGCQYVILFFLYLASGQ